MKHFKISHFKAFSHPDFEVDLSSTGNKPPKYLLVYGSNGTGKTSIQEALRYSFFRTQDSNFEKVPSLLAQEEKLRRIQEVRNLYRNQQSADAFSIEIDGVDVLSTNFHPEDYNAYFLRRSDISVQGEIYLKDMLEELNYGRRDIEDFLHQFSEDLKKDVNDALKNRFYTDLEIVSFDASDRWKVTIHDNEHGLTSAMKLSASFNEANLTLICLLLLTRCIWLWNIKGKKNLLVLDDFVTSLDAANRITITKYLMDTIPQSYQLIILTHNVNYYNLLLHYINTLGNKESWVVVNLIHVARRHRYYTDSGVKMSDKIRKDYEGKTLNDSEYRQLGNQIRQCFEARLHELIGLVMLGGFEETKNILDKLLSQETIYYKEGKDLQTLVGEIDRSSRVYAVRAACSMKVIRKKIDDYRVRESNDLINTLRELRLYQKVFMHPLSHGTLGATQWSDAEVRKSLDLLKRLELSINAISNGKF